MRSVGLVIAFVAGLAVGASVMFIIKKDTINTLENQLLAEKTLTVALEKRAKDAEREAAEKRKQVESLTSKLEKQIVESNNRRRELLELKAEIQRLKEIMKRAGIEETAKKPSPSDKEKDKKEEKEKQAELLEKLKTLLGGIELHPSDRDLMKQFADAVWGLKDAGELEKMVKRLREIYEEALKVNPDDTDLLLNRGRAYGAELTYLQLKMKENPMVYGPKMGEVAIKALNCFNKVLQKNPDDNDARLTRAFWCYYSPGEIKQAEKDFKELVKRAKKGDFGQELGEQAFLGLVMTYRKLGKKEDARKAAEEGLSLYPQSEKLRKLLNSLSK